MVGITFRTAKAYNPGMVKGPLPDRLEFAILKLVMDDGGSHQVSMGYWRLEVSRLVPDLADPADLKACVHTAAFRWLLTPMEISRHSTD